MANNSTILTLDFDYHIRRCGLTGNYDISSTDPKITLTFRGALIKLLDYNDVRGGMVLTTIG